MWENVGIIIAILAFLLNFFGTVFGGFWKLSQLQTNLSREIGEAKKEVEERQDVHVRQFGETIAAIRQRVSDVELYAANHYVRRDGFYKVQELLESSIRALGDKIEKRLERMEEKIDSKT